MQPTATADPEPAAAAATPRPGRVPERTVLLVASFGALLAFLDATIVNVAFPSIRNSFAGSSIGTISWILNAYNIVLAAFMIVFGRLCDLIGRRRIYLAGLVLFTVASAWCALSGSVGMLVAARLAQAVGAAMLIPASLGLVIEAFPLHRRAHGVGLWGAVAAVAAGLGPPIGGALVEAGGWRWAFIVNIPLGIAAVVLGRRFLVESRSPGRRRMPDLVGAALLAGALGLGTTAIIKADEWGSGSARLWASVVGFLVLLAGFVLSSRRHPSPLLAASLLRSRSFVMANVVTIAAGMGFYAYMLTNILWLQYVWHYSVLKAGLSLAPAAFVAAVAAARLGPIAARRGYRPIVFSGALIWVLAYLWYVTRVGTEPAFLREWLPGQVLSGLGAGICLPLLGSAALAALPGGGFGTASAVVSSARQIGGVLGISVLVVVVGAPTPANAVAVFRDGWRLSVACFVLCALLVLFLGNVRAGATTGSDATGSDGQIHVPDPGTLSHDGSPPRPSLFSTLPPEARNALTAQAVERYLPAGTWLFRRGEVATTMYVLVAGRAEVIVDDTLLRELGPGSVLGELAVITGETRSASVRARRDCRLLEVSRELWDQTLGSNPTALSAIVHSLAGQLASPRSRTAPRPRPHVIAVVGASAGAPAEQTAQVLHAALSADGRADLLTAANPEQLDRAEEFNERVLLVAATTGPWADFCIRSADLVVLVARTGEPRTLGEFGGLRPDLVLVGAPATQAELAAWSQVFDPWRITQTREENLPTALRSLSDRLTGRSLGMVLSGGGARALAHLGVLYEFEEAGLTIDRVAGASVGSLIGALHADELPAAHIEEVIYRNFVRRKIHGDYVLPRRSLARGGRVARALELQYGDRLVEGLPHGFACVSTDLLTRSVVVHRRGRVVDAVRASVNLPVLFAPIAAGNHLLIDGGVLDNLPVHLLTERDEGPVVAVNVAMSRGTNPRLAGAHPTVPAVRKTIRVPAMGETLLRTIMIGGGDTGSAERSGAFVITPNSMGVGLMEFHQIDQMIASGRAAARRLLEETGGTFGAA
ncbi:MAG: MFS transporter [Nostocoides sp.]